MHLAGAIPDRQAMHLVERLEEHRVERLEEHRVGASGGAPGGALGGSPGGGIVPPSVPTYEDVKFRADAKLQSLYMNAKMTFLKLGQQYADTNDKAKREAIKKQGEASLASFASQFDSVVSQVEAEFNKYNYSTSIIQDYRQKYKDELDAGRELMSDMMKS